jgi:CheY-specific phosphatase CheX
MNSKLNELIRDVGEETFETLAYMLPIPSVDDQPVAVSADAAATVAFRGPFTGILAISVARDILDELAANMLGIDSDELSEAHRSDALKELLSAVCGNLLPRLAGREAVFDVMAAELAPEGVPAQVAGRGPVGMVSLELDSGNANLMLFVETEIPAIAALSA